MSTGQMLSIANCPVVDDFSGNLAEWNLSFNVQADGKGYVLLLNDVTDKTGSAWVSDESGIISCSTPLLEIERAKLALPVLSDTDSSPRGRAPKSECRKSFARSVRMFAAGLPYARSAIRRAYT
jgi:hypothetical protein